MKITDKHKQFCRELLKNQFNQTKAYQAVYPKSKSENARVHASRLMTKDNIQQYLEKLKSKQEKKELITIDEIVIGIKKVLDNCTKEDEAGNIKEAGALKALELLGKYKSMFTDNVKVQSDVRNVLTFSQAAKKKSK